MRLNSTYLKGVSYNPTDSTMIVYFADGAMVKYFGIHPRTYQAIVAAESHGEKFHELIRDKRFTVLKQAA